MDKITHSILYDYYFEDKEKCNPDSNEKEIKFNGHTYIIKKEENAGIEVRRKNVTLIDSIGNFFSRLSNNNGKASNLIKNVIEANKDFDKNCDTKIEGICLSGGGAKGLAYLGILKQLGAEKLGNVKQVSGASAGAITAVLIALGMSPDEIWHFVTNQEQPLTNENLEKSIKSCLINQLKKIDEKILANVLNDSELPFKEEKLADITFSQLNELRKITQKETDAPKLKELFLSSSLYHEKEQLTAEVKMSAENTPDMPIWKAALASAAIPLPWAIKKISPIKLDPVPFDSKFIDGLLSDSEGEHCLKGAVLRDGGIHNNIPFIYLNQDQNNLILSFSKNKEIHERQLSVINRIKQFFCGEPAYERRQFHHKYADKIGVLYIDPGIGTTDVKKGLKNLDKITYEAAKQLDYYLRTNKDKGINKLNDEDKKKYPK